jgi:hypothetical protein
MVQTSIIHRRLKRSLLSGSTTTGERADHASKSLLSCGVPKLQTDFDAVDKNLFGYKKGAAGGGGILWVELVLGIPIEETGLANSWEATMSGRECGGAIKMYQSCPL